MQCVGCKAKFHIFGRMKHNTTDPSIILGGTTVEQRIQIVLSIPNYIPLHPDFAFPNPGHLILYNFTVRSKVSLRRPVHHQQTALVTPTVLPIQCLQLPMVTVDHGHAVGTLKNGMPCKWTFPYTHRVSGV